MSCHVSLWRLHTNGCGVLIARWCCHGSQEPRLWTLTKRGVRAAVHTSAATETNSFKRFTWFTREDGIIATSKCAPCLPEPRGAPLLSFRLTLEVSEQPLLLRGAWRFAGCWRSPSTIFCNSLKTWGKLRTQRVVKRAWSVKQVFPSTPVSIAATKSWRERTDCKQERKVLSRRNVMQK